MSEGLAVHDDNAGYLTNKKKISNCRTWIRVVGKISQQKAIFYGRAESSEEDYRAAFLMAGAFDGWLEDLGGCLSLT